MLCCFLSSSTLSIYVLYIIRWYWFDLMYIISSWFQWMSFFFYFSFCRFVTSNDSKQSTLTWLCRISTSLFFIAFRWLCVSLFSVFCFFYFIFQWFLHKYFIFVRFIIDSLLPIPILMCLCECVRCVFFRKWFPVFITSRVDVIISVVSFFFLFWFSRINL